MKLHVLSDLHLEFMPFDPPQTDADVVVLAGDIGIAAQGIHWARGSFPDKEIVFVPGNHEFYGSQRLDTIAMMRIAARECNVRLLDDDEIVIHGVRFLGMTLWTDFMLFGEAEKPWVMREGQQYLADFRVIHEGLSGHFSPQHSIDLHKTSLAWLKAKLAEPFNGKTVVVTHHLPSALSVADRFIEEPLSACFASNLYYLFGQMDLWIHGHTHDTFDYSRNGTRVVCNPRGYVTRNGGENNEFDPALIVEV